MIPVLETVLNGLGAYATRRDATQEAECAIQSFVGPFVPSDLSPTHLVPTDYGEEKEHYFT